MPKVRYEADDGDHDLSDLFEPIKPIKEVRGRKQTGTSRSAGKSKPVPSKERGLYSARRFVIAGQSQVFGAAVAEALGKSDTDVKGVYVTEPHATILTRARSQKFFNSHFTAGNERPKAVAAFNRAVTGYVRLENQDRPVIPVRLGKLGIFGTSREAGHGTRFIGVYLSGEGGEQLRDEYVGIAAALDAAKFCSSPIEAEPPGSERHISLGKTSSQEQAEAFIAELKQAGTLAAISAQLVTPDNPEGLLVMGALTPELHHMREVGVTW
jgi:hypothetical protein